MEYEIITYDHVENLKASVIELQSCAMHIHREFEVIMILHGTLKVKTDKAERLFSEKSIIALSSRQPHELLAIDVPAVLLCEWFSPELYSSFFPVAAHMEFEDIDVSGTMPDRQAWELRDWILLLTSFVHYNSLNFNNFLCVSTACWILHDILCWLPWKKREYISEQDSRIARITDYIEANCTSKLLLSDIAKDEGLTTAYLSHYFKKQIGMSFQGYVSLIRLEHARVLIEQTNLTLSEIALCCGFSDVRYLNKVFQKYLGCNVKEYRMTQQQVSIVSPISLTGRHLRVLPQEEAIAVLTEWNKRQDWSIGSRLRYPEDFDPNHLKHG